MGRPGGQHLELLVVFCSDPAKRNNPRQGIQSPPNLKKTFQEYRFNQI